jgi:beta-1,3-galactosyltransferase 2
MAKARAKIVYIFLSLSIAYAIFFTLFHENLSTKIEDRKFKISHHRLHIEHPKISNERDFEEFKINPKEFLCQVSSKKSILFIAFVIIAPHFFEKRDLIRSTWGNKSISDDFKIIFTIGMSENEEINKQIEEEHKINKDILQINNFMDNYYNLTTKIVKSFQWISKYCSNAKYILRINDDVILNTFSLIEHFKRLPYKTNQAFGFALYNAGVNRDLSHKFSVSEKIYPKSTFDDYVDGNI